MNPNLKKEFCFWDDYESIVQFKVSVCKGVKNMIRYDYTSGPDM